MIASIFYNFTKRFCDILFSLVGLILTLPIFLFTAIAIKLSSPGPIFYVSKRTGKNHNDFDFYKFRSMHVTESDKGLFIADKDRLFAVGEFIRKTKIDELPQLINIIKGDMSIVGPRPMPSISVDRTYYGKYQRLLEVKPGLTSVASLYDYVVGDKYNDNDKYIKEILPKKLELEILYLKKRSISYDFKLIIRTIMIIIGVILGKKKFAEFPEIKEIY